MSELLTHYAINENTMALLAVAQLEYATIVLENNRQLFVKETPNQLIKAACLEGGSTYDGRRVSVMFHTHAQRKVPIPINPYKNIFAFPTQSPSNFHCHWLFYHHIKTIKPNSSSPTPNTESIITFKNNQSLAMPVSNYILEKQMLRTALCVHSFSSMAL